MSGFKCNEHICALKRLSMCSGWRSIEGFTLRYNVWVWWTFSMNKIPGQILHIGELIVFGSFWTVNDKFDYLDSSLLFPSGPCSLYLCILPSHWLFSFPSFLQPVCSFVVIYQNDRWWVFGAFFPSKKTKNNTTNQTNKHHICNHINLFPCKSII